MIDYDKPDDDPIVAEVRRIREEIFAEYNFDLEAYMTAMQQREGMTGRKYATPQTTDPKHVKKQTFQP